MAKKGELQRTKYPGVYKNNRTGLYDTCYSYKVYDVKTGANKYPQHWTYGFKTLSEAHQSLAREQAGIVEDKDEDITLQGAFELWKQVAEDKGYSLVTIANTTQHMKMLENVVSLKTKMKIIDEDMYQKICTDMRKHNYSENTLYSLNATLRKLLRLCYRKKLISNDVLKYADNMKFDIDYSHRIITRAEYDKLMDFFTNQKFVRLGVNKYDAYKFITAVLYFSAMRIGEILALTKSDFDFKTGHIIVDKSYVSAIKITKRPKNFKSRKIPMADELREIAEWYFEKYDLQDDERIFNMEHGAVIQMLKNTSEKVGIDAPEEINCHGFRHTCATNLLMQGCPVNVVAYMLGDTIETTLKHYIDLFGDEDKLILNVLNNL